ncbi:MAG: MBL fold metallo-hydrolase [Sedimentisphaerales bacterium]|nr:MBL fold metallo-hydrolase [Sedimentisphaerales bacterium]
MPSHSLARIAVDDIEIIGYSVAGEETVVAVPQLDVCFDIGKAPDQIIPINHVLLTHGHMDHAAGLAYYLSHRKFCGHTEGTVLAPVDLIPHIRQILDAWGRLDGTYVPANLVGVVPGDEYKIKPNLIARVFPTKHCRGSVGYSIIETRRKLKTEYTGLTGPQIVELKKQGFPIDNPMEIPLVTYLGDTKYVDFSSLDYVANSKVMIAECTFFFEEHLDRADAGRHMHIDEFGRLLEGLHNDHIVVTHLTQRTAIREAKAMMKEKLDKDIYDRITILMDRRSMNRINNKK